MNFENLSDFLAMGGHGLYVWLSYGVGLAVFVANVVIPMRKKKEIVKKQGQRLRREKMAS